MNKKYNYQRTNCLVSGGAGFIGQNIVKALIKEGASVYVVDNFSYGTTRDNVDIAAMTIEGDIRDADTFTKLPQNIKFDYFFHFAAPSSITLFNISPAECLSITITGFLNAIKFCTEKKIKFIYPSTGSLYAGTKPPNSETSPLDLRALNTYAKAKLALENIQSAYGKQCDSLGLRIFAGYGPSEKHKGDFASVIYMFCRQMIIDEQPVIFGDGQQKRDFLYIDDLIEYILILSQNCEESIVNVGSGASTSFNEAINMINKVLNKKIQAVYIDKPASYLEETRAQVDLLYKYCSRPKFSIDDGISKIVEQEI